jgi:general secretion pathway protein H
VLGPEPLIAPQRIELSSAAQPGLVLWVATDGLRPFVLQRHAPELTP